MKIAIFCIWVSIGFVLLGLLDMQRQLRASVEDMNERIANVRIELMQTTEQVRALQGRGDVWMYVPGAAWQRVTPYKAGFIYVETPEMRRVQQAGCMYSTEHREPAPGEKIIMMEKVEK